MLPTGVFSKVVVSFKRKADSVCLGSVQGSIEEGSICYGSLERDKVFVKKWIETGKSRVRQLIIEVDEAVQDARVAGGI